MNSHLFLLIKKKKLKRQLSSQKPITFLSCDKSYLLHSYQQQQKNIMSGLATPRRVVISWFNLDLSSVFHRDPSAPGFFQGLTEELNGEMADSRQHS